MTIEVNTTGSAGLAETTRRISGELGLAETTRRLSGERGLADTTRRLSGELGLAETTRRLSGERGLVETTRRLSGERGLAALLKLLYFYCNHSKPFIVNILYIISLATSLPLKLCFTRKNSQLGNFLSGCD